MDNYKLKEDEVVLYKGNVVLDGKKVKTQLILTNQNLVFMTRNSEALTDDVSVNAYHIEDIKIYKGTPQVKPKNNKVEIYFLSTEVEIKFSSIIEQNKFTTQIINLLTDTTKAQRYSQKIKDGINLVNDTLGVDVVKATGNLIKTGIKDNIAKKINPFKK